MNKALFLDRDGVINIDTGHVHKIEDFVFRYEIFDICKEAILNSYFIIVVTNQAGIGRGLYSEKEFRILNDYMLKEFKKKEIEIMQTYFCPYHPTKGKGKYLKKSIDRKPLPGMFHKAKNEFKLNMKKSIMIGDKETDKSAALSAGITKYVDATKENWVFEAFDYINMIY